MISSQEIEAMVMRAVINDLRQFVLHRQHAGDRAILPRKHLRGASQTPSGIWPGTYPDVLNVLSHRWGMGTAWLVVCGACFGAPHSRPRCGAYGLGVHHIVDNEAAAHAIAALRSADGWSCPT